jgi:cystathionine gamma-lyase
MGHWGETEKRLKAFAGMKFETLAIHGGQHPDPVTGSVMPPIHQTSTFAQKSPGQTYSGFEYARTHNPTRRSLEDCLALLEGGVFGLACSSGMNAVSLLLSLLGQGDDVLVCDDVYGGTYRLFTKILTPAGLRFQFLNLSVEDPAAVLLKSATPKTKMVWIETPTNPMLKLIDIRKVAQVCQSKGWILVVDNTFMSPVFQRPLELGADVVLHSLTKYMNGHSDVVAGALMLRRQDLAEKLYFNQNSMGAIAGPFDSWLVMRSLKTLPVRMAAHQRNAMELARWLEKHPKVEKVLYPGLESHPQHALAKTQMSGFGGMISCYIKGGGAKASAMLSRVKIFTLAESLGGVESLIEHPAIMTHASVPADLRQANGIHDNFVRLSVGLENLDDLKADLDQALA